MSNYINDIKLRQNGEIVFCTNQGLSFFNNNVPMGGDDFHLDSLDNIWASNWSGDTEYYDGETIITHQLTIGDCDGPCPIFSSYIDNSGNVWFDSSEGLFMYNGLDYLLVEDRIIQASCIRSGAENDLWFAGQAGLEMYDGESW